MEVLPKLLFNITKIVLILTVAQGTLVKPRIYQVLDVSSTCNSQQIKARLEFNRNFNGVVYAKGFPLEKNCRSLGSGENFVEISIDTSGCGVRLISVDDETLTYRVTLHVQVDKLLQQINDLEISTTCNISYNDMIYPTQVSLNKQISRTGRTKMSKSEVQPQNEALSKIKTWMEIEGTGEENKFNKVAVGEQTVMLIKSFLPENIAANIVDCYAYDGTKDVVQKLINENGCPLDKTIMPSLEVIKFEEEGFPEENEIAWDEGEEEGNSISSRALEKLQRQRGKEGFREKRSVEAAGGKKDNMRLQVLGTMFSAFKFPDTANLHLKCSLQLCKEICPEVSCSSDAEESQSRSGKSIQIAKNTSSVIDRIEVFNSVEVVAPGIDSDNYPFAQDEADLRAKLDDNFFCLSASKMAFSFAILGAVFLCGVLAALWTVLRNHLRKVKKLDGSEQILVVRDSPMNFFNSRNNLYKKWTYS